MHMFRLLTLFVPVSLSLLFLNWVVIFKLTKLHVVNSQWVKYKFIKNSLDGLCICH